MREKINQSILRGCTALLMVVMINLACSQTQTVERLTPTVHPTEPNPASTPPAIFSQRVENSMKPGIVFGLTEIKKIEFNQYVPELKTDWISAQPLVIWYNIEKVAGQYNWNDLDEEIIGLQRAGLDCTPILIPLTIDADQYVKITKRIGKKDILEYLRYKESADMALYPHEPDDFKHWRHFLDALVERYDADGSNDAPGLRFPVTNWRVLDEYPSIWFTDVHIYVQLLQTTYDEIHSLQPQAKIILLGLESSLGRRFAFGEGFITDKEAGIENGVLLSRSQVYGNRTTQQQKKDYEYVIKEGISFYDAVDIHLYEPKSTFIPGKIDWLRNELSIVGVDVPIWSLEGGGPYKLKGGQKSIFGDKLFGNYSDKENAQFVAEMMALASAGGIERMAYPLAENEGTNFYNGPYTNMGLIHPNGTKKPSYYTFIMVADFMRGYTQIIDLSSGKMRLYEYNIDGRLKYVGWMDSEPKDETTNMIKLLPGNRIRIQPIVTELDNLGRAVIPDAELTEAEAVPMSRTPLLIDEP